jgi:hypothetical protein
VATKIVLSPKLPSALIDIARSLGPAEFELQVADQGTPDFPAAMKDAEYLVGFARASLGAEFYRGAPRLKLIQLISAGYDRLDIGAARPGPGAGRQQRRLEFGRGGRAHLDADSGRAQEARLASSQRHHRQVACRQLLVDPDVRAGR